MGSHGVISQISHPPFREAVFALVLVVATPSFFVESWSSYPGLLTGFGITVIAQYATGKYQVGEIRSLVMLLIAVIIGYGIASIAPRFTLNAILGFAVATLALYVLLPFLDV